MKDTAQKCINSPASGPTSREEQELPIGLFAPQSQEIFEKKGVEAFYEMREFGANLLLGTYPQITDKMLDWADQAGMRVLIYNAEVEFMSPEEAAQYVRRYKDHPAYYGIQIADEPSIERMENMSAVCRAILQEDPMHYLWVDLLPTYAGFNSERHYEEYVANYMKNISPNVAVYDHYGILHHKIREDFYLNQELVMKYARQRHLPVWTFALCTAHGDYEETSVEQMRWQVSNQLATGSKGIQWFTYGQPAPMFATPPIDAGGKRTKKFEEVKTVNQEIKPYGHILMELEHIGTIFWCNHAQPPKQQVPFLSWEPISQISGDPAVIGCFRDREQQPTLYVANYSYDKPAVTHIELNDGYTDHIELWSSEGKFRQPCNGRITVDLLPGEGKLIRLLKMKSKS